MTKRVSTPDNNVDGLERAKKRQRLIDSAQKAPKVELKPEVVYSAHQLRKLLLFEQGEVTRLRNGIQSLKIFLESILYPGEDSDLPRQLSILKEFLDDQRPRTIRDETPSFLPDLFQCWSYASDINNDALNSAVIAVLALLLKTITDRIDFREQGLLLCRVVLQQAHIKLLSRALSAPKHKEHLISPSLRLLTEIVSYDAGAVAKQVYNRRDFTFEPNTIGRNLSMWRRTTENSNRPPKPTVRSNAVRYVLANLKHQNEGVKVDILKQAPVVRALVDHIKDDMPQLACEILSVIKTHVLSDPEIPRSSKGFLLTSRSLTTISTMYRSGHNSEEQSLQKTTHDFLIKACTSYKLGVMYNSSGWYPPGVDGKTSSRNKGKPMNRIDLGLESDVWSAGTASSHPIRNGTIATFLQHLKPYTYELEMELILDIFKSTPELVADYFRRKADFAFDPKLTSTWIGYATFLYSVILLPIPKYFGLKDFYSANPPPVSTTIENLLPLPLTRKVLTRCLNMDSDLTSLFAIRILAVSFQKLKEVMRRFEEAGKLSKSDKWEQASKSLINAFCLRIPKMKEVVTAFNRLSLDHHVQREAITRLIGQYYDLVPQIAFETKFNCSVALASSLRQWAKTRDIEDGYKRLYLLELKHLTQIAASSPDMNWWQRPESLKFSPFTTLLELVSLGTHGEESEISLQRLVAKIVEDNEILQVLTEPSPLVALIESLRQIHKYKGESATNVILGFLDDCINRLVRKPIKYLDDLEKFKSERHCHRDVKPGKPLSLLIMPLDEQWRYLSGKNRDGPQNSHVADWMNLFLAILIHIGEDEIVLKKIQEDVAKACGANVNNIITAALSSNGTLNTNIGKLETERVNSASKDADVATLTNGVGHDPGEIITEELPTEDQNHTGLNRWTQHDVEEIIEDGHAGKLILCLCSTYPEIRRQALTGVSKLSTKVENSTYEEWEQVDLLLGQVIETSKSVIEIEPFPYIGGVFASRALLVLADPTHEMYPKINEYLNRGPTWNVERLPSYWADKIILSTPSDDREYHKEVDWYVDMIHDGLRTPKDMEIFRLRGVFERILSLYNAPSSEQRLKEKVIRIIFRAASIEGGSTTLITRFGVLGWIEGQLARGDHHEGYLKVLKARLMERCDKEKVDEWRLRTVSRANARLP